MKKSISFGLPRLSLAMTRCQRQAAFTLAEVLLTLMIIGIVAAYTIPSIINDTQDKELRVAWKKEFSAYSQAMMKWYMDEGGEIDYLYYWSNGSRLLDKLSEYLNVVQKYPRTGDDQVFGSSTRIYKTMDGSSYANTGLDNGAAILSDGSSFMLYTTNATRIILISIDVNGPKKGPNVLGRDLFGFQIFKTAWVPVGHPMSTERFNVSDSTTWGVYGYITPGNVIGKCSTTKTAGSYYYFPMQAAGSACAADNLMK